MLIIGAKGFAKEVLEIFKQKKPPRLRIVKRRDGCVAVIIG